MTEHPTSAGSPELRRITARESVIGTDTVIRRALPSAKLRTVGAWCFLDHAGPVQFAPGHGMHVGPHPHIGLQTFTWMIEGEVLHRDSLGCEQLIRPGQVNLMTAGRGIVHSEDTPVDGDRLHAAQLWIALPDSQRHREPDFRNFAELPVLERGGLRVTVLAGTAFGRTSPVQVYTPLVGLDILSTQAQADELPLDPGFEHAALVLRGQALVAGETLVPGELLYLGRGRETLALRCEADTQVLLLGGEPFSEAPLLWWNFVARNQAEIEQALADWNRRSPRFPAVAGAVTPPIDAPSMAGVRLKSGA